MIAGVCASAIAGARGDDAAARSRLDRPDDAAADVPQTFADSAPLAPSGGEGSLDDDGRHRRGQDCSTPAGGGADVRNLVREAPVMPDTMDALDALEILRDSDRATWRSSMTNTASSRAS